MLDARADVEGMSVMLHSHGGSTGGRPERNSDYPDALIQICRRGLASAAFARIAIDSSPSQKVVDEERTLFTRTELAGYEPAELALEIGRRLAAWGRSPSQGPGGNPRKRVRFDLRFVTPVQVLKLRTKPDAEPAPQIPVATIRALTRAQLESAVKDLRAGLIERGFSDRTHYSVLLDDGTRLPPKAIIGLALQKTLGRVISGRAFRGGDSTPAFAVLREHGFTIINEPADRAGSDTKAAVDEALGTLSLTDEDLRFVEGSVRRAHHLRRERDRKLVALFKSNFRQKHGQLHCERCEQDWVSEYGQTVADACFEAHHHTTQVADMQNGHESKLEDLRLLCANCHRAAHRELKLREQEG